MYFAVWIFLLSAFWLLLSGFLQPLLLSFGAVSVALVFWLLRRMDNRDQSIQVPSLGPRKLSYFVWLIGQIFISSVEVAKAVWGSKHALNPQLATLKSRKLKDRGRVLYANSITLTPGTLCVDVCEDVVTVHALQADSLKDLESGDMESRVAKAVNQDQQAEGGNS